MKTSYIANDTYAHREGTDVPHDYSIAAISFLCADIHKPAHVETIPHAAFTGVSQSRIADEMP